MNPFRLQTSRLTIKDYVLVIAVTVLSFCSLFAVSMPSHAWIVSLSGGFFSGVLTALFLTLRRLDYAVRQLQRKEFIHQAKKKMRPEQERAKLYEFMGGVFGMDIEKLDQEYRESDFKRRWDIRKKELMDQGLTSGVSSDFDCETLYLLVRAVRPEIVVEAGVQDGASTAHILQALKDNEKGRLYSIDLVDEEHPTPQAHLVEDPLRARWELILGDSKVELPKLLNRFPAIDLFFHDSKHSYEHMMFEYETSFRFFKECGGVLASHDVITPPFEKNAFLEFCKRHQLRYGIFRNIGIGIKEPILQPEPACK